ncbi:hypothetical protein, partial [Nostoc sp. CCY 9925]|uniref:hypothetical protein n=1 Tax=Nostoc sp. CCY 9925 TaxID=3103865 RepID=UPI0039C5D474
MRAEQADLRLWVRAPGDPEGVAADYAQSGDLVIANKADVGTVTATRGLDSLTVSTQTGQGLS